MSWELIVVDLYRPTTSLETAFIRGRGMTCDLLMTSASFFHAMGNTEDANTLNQDNKRSDLEINVK